MEGVYSITIIGSYGRSFVYELSRKTGINVKDISLQDADVASMFHGREVLHTGLKDGIDALAGCFGNSFRWLRYIFIVIRHY